MTEFHLMPPHRKKKKKKDDNLGYYILAFMSGLGIGLIIMTLMLWGCVS